MSQQVLPILGAVVGSFWGQPQLGYAIGAAIGGIVASTESKPGPRLGDLPAQSFDEGVPRAIVYGTSQTSGYVIAAGPAIKTTEFVDGGGKGGGSIETEVAYRSYAIAMCEGPIAGVLRVWADDKLVYDIRPESLIRADSERWISNKNIFLGDESQLPSTFLELNVSGEDTPAYRGTAYMVFGLEDLTERRGTIPMYRFEVAHAVTPNTEIIPKVETFLLGGIEAGGNYPVGSSITRSTSGQGSVWMAVVEFRNAQTPSTFSAFVKIDGETVWGQPVTIAAGGYELLYVQVNAPPTGVSIETGWNGPYQGDVRIGIHGANEQCESVLDARVVVAGIEEFGLVLNSDNQYAGMEALEDRYENDIQWGPDSIDNGASGDPTSLEYIVADICARSGLSTGDIDTSGLTDSVDGITLASDYTASSAVDVLRACYFFDKSEPGEKLYFPKRGGGVALVFDIDDLVEIPDMSRREQASEVPKKVNLHYANATAGYAPIKSTYTRSSQDILSTMETTLQVPVVLDTDQAAQMVEKMFKVSSADAQGEIKISVPDSFIRIVPSDCIGLNLRGQIRRLRVDDIEMADGVMHLTCRSDRQSAYTSVLTGIPVDPPSMPPSTIPGETIYAVMDLPARIDSEDDLNYLVAGIGNSEGWTGWSYQRSFDSGANFNQVRSIQMPAIIGTLIEEVSSASSHYTDNTNTIKVQLIRTSQTLEDLTEFQFLSEGGAFALKSQDGWEIIQYLDASDDGDGAYTLSVLHRGLLNTEPSAHFPGDMFVVLDRASHIPAQSAWLGANISHRGVSLRSTNESGLVKDEVFTGQSQTEWPVSYLSVEDSSSGEIYASWIPRHRFGSDVNPIASINFQGFRALIDDGMSSVSIDVSSPELRYDASTFARPLSISVSSLNRITGAGPAVTKVI